MKIENETVLGFGLCIAVAAACVATHSADPLWLLLFLFWIL